MGIFKPILGSAHFPAGSAGLALTFGGPCPGDRWPSATCLFCPSHSTSVPGQCWATSDISFLAGSLLTDFLSLSLPGSLCPSLILPEFVSLPLFVSLSLAASVSTSLGPTLRPSLRISVPISALPLSFSASLCLGLSLCLCLCLSQCLCLCLPLAGFRSD